MGKIKDLYLNEAEVAAVYADRFDEDDCPGSEAYHQRLHDEHAFAMWEQIEKLENNVANLALANGVRHDLDIIIATMRRIMPALD